VGGLGVLIFWDFVFALNDVLIHIKYFFAIWDTISFKVLYQFLDVFKFCFLLELLL